MKNSWILFSLAAAVLLAVRGITQKLALPSLSTGLVTLTGGSVSLFVFLVHFWISGDFSHKPKPGQDQALFWAALQGLLSALAVLLSLSAMRRGPLSLVSPLVALNLAFVCFLSFLFLKEKLTGSQVLGVSLMAFGAVLVSR